MSGLEGTFNTFRLGTRYSKLLVPGDRVLLIDKAKMVCFGRAVVKKIEVGKLADMAIKHAHNNHNQKETPKDEAPAVLTQNMIRRYGPHMVNENKRVTVIYLKMV